VCTYIGESKGERDERKKKEKREREKEEAHTSNAPRQNTS